MFQRSSIGSILVLFSLGSTQGEPVVWLRHGPFDPLTDVQTVEQALTASESVNVYIVQFDGGAFETFKKEITALGSSVYTYLPENAYVVRMSPSVKAQVAALPFVRWVGKLHPAYRLEDFIRVHVGDPDSSLFPSHRYNILVFENGTAQIEGVVSDIIDSGGVVHDADGASRLVEATLTPQQLLSIVQSDAIHFVGRWSPTILFMEVVREFSGANAIEFDGCEVNGYTGCGVRGEVIDSEFNLSHPDLQNPPLQEHKPALCVTVIGSGEGSGGWHGAHTSGIIFGDATGCEGSEYPRGLLPDG